MDISTNTLISNIFHPKPAPNATSNMDAIAEKFAAIQPGASAPAAKLSSPPTIDTTNDPNYQPYATIILDGEVVATIDNHGWTGTSSSLGAKISDGLPGEANGTLIGPELAQARAEYIADLLGGEIQHADTAQTQAQFNTGTAPLAQTAQSVVSSIIYQNDTAETLFNTQRAAAAEDQDINAEEATTAADEFLEYMSKSSAELWRERILESLGLTEESLAQLPPDERIAAEEKITNLIREKIEAENERAQKENSKTNEMTQLEQKDLSTAQNNGNSSPLNSDLSGLQSADPKIAQILDLAPETIKAYSNAQQKSEEIELSKREKREPILE